MNYETLLDEASNSGLIVKEKPLYLVKAELKANR